MTKTCLNASLLCLALSMGLASGVHADAPALIPVQGFLSDAKGAPVKGTHRITFTIYDAKSAGKKQHTDDFEKLDVNNGVFVAYLGTQTDLDLALFQSKKELWLEVVVDGSEIISPRMQLGSVPYAAYAQSCGDAANASEAVHAATAADATMFGGKSPSDFVANSGNGTIAGDLSVSGTLAVSGMSPHTGDVGCEPMTTGGTCSGVAMNDRVDGHPRWVAYANAGSYRLYADGPGDLMSVDTSGVVDFSTPGTFDPNGVAANHIQVGHVHAANGWDATGLCGKVGGATMCTATNGGNFYWGYQSNPTTMDTAMTLFGSNGNLSITGTLTQASSERFKKDIHFLGDQDLAAALSTIEATPVATYHYKTAVKGSKLNYGVIAEHTPSALLSDDGKAVNLSNTIGMLLAAVKAQQQEISGLKSELKALRRDRR